MEAFGPPVVIGGSGGSGTRVVKQIVEVGGIFLGARLNETQHDALDLGLFDTHWGPRWFAEGATDEIVAAFDAALAAHVAPMPAGARGWGWKHPMSHLLLPFLAERLPDLRFVHVVRDGRDMALSSNQTQQGLFRQWLLDEAEARAPRRERALAFWARANLRTADFGERELGSRYLRVRFEDVCSRPDAAATALLAFVGVDADTAMLRTARSVVSPPETLGRWRDAPDAPRATGVGAEALRRFGYATT